MFNNSSVKSFLVFLYVGSVNYCAKFTVGERETLLSPSRLKFDLTHKFQALSDEARFWGAFAFYAVLTLVRRFNM
jgi:hypothetical protein